MLPQKPYAISCDRNSEPLLEQFREILKNSKSMLEVGAGTGQHAIFMAPHFLEMTWSLADRKANHEGIALWLNDFPRANIRGPLEYEIGQTSLPPGSFDTVFAANVLHIISWDLCLKFFDDLKSLPEGAKLLFYGAFSYDGNELTASNQKFEGWLKEKDPQSGIRSFNQVTEELNKRNIHLLEDIEMPASNRLLVYQMQPS